MQESSQGSTGKFDKLDSRCHSTNNLDDEILALMSSWSDCGSAVIAIEVPRDSKP